MTKIKKRHFGTALLLIFLLFSCGGENSAPTTPKAGNELTPLNTNTIFSAIFSQTIKKDRSGSFKSDPVLVSGSSQSVTPNSQSKSYNGKMQVINLLTESKEEFDWPLTQTMDDEGNISTVSHRELPLKSGIYDFVLLLTAKDAVKSQYTAKALAQRIVDGESPVIRFVLSPNLGDPIRHFDEIRSLSTLSFSWTEEDLLGLQLPQFGISINEGDEGVYVINKKTGLSALTLNVQPGEYRLRMRLYDGDKMLGKNEQDENLITLIEGENAQVKMIPLQAGINIRLDPIKDESPFSFIVPSEIVTEVGGAQNVTLLVRLGGIGVPVQEKRLDVLDENGIFKARGVFETGGQPGVTAYLAFHRTTEAATQFSDVPLARCNTRINVEQTKTLGCNLELKRESLLTRRILGTLMLSVLDEENQSAMGAEVFLNGELVGLTGTHYSTGSIKTQKEAGNYKLKVQKEALSASGDFLLAPLEMKNEFLNLETQADTIDFIRLPDVELPDGFTNHNGELLDFDGDGDLDALIPRFEKNELIIALNDGKGKFTVVEPAFSSHYSLSGLVVADIDGDNDKDILVLSGIFSEEAHQFFYNQGNGYFIPGQKITIETGYPSHFRTENAEGIAKFGDLDKDGDLDLITNINTDSLGIFINDGKGKYTKHPFEPFIYKSNPIGLAIADFNQDKYQDIYAGGRIWINNQQGDFLPLNVPSLESAVGKVISADFNGDGAPDLFSNGGPHPESGKGNHSAILFLNKGNGEFTVSTQDFHTQYNIHDSNAADFNGDAIADLITSMDNSVNSYLYSKSPEMIKIKISDEGLRWIKTGDLDNDGDIDLMNLLTHIRVYLNQRIPNAI